MNITVLAGGTGGAKFLVGLRAWAREQSDGHQLTAVVNTGDDMWLAGLRITPDLDTITYQLAGINDAERGWGRAGESERVSAELEAWGVGWPWFTLGDLDLGAHISRTSWLRDGVPLHEVVTRIGSRWDLGVGLLPATDDEVETWVHVDDGRVMHFQEWWTRYRAQIVPTSFEQRGVETATASPGVVEAIRDADLVILAPSNPVVSIGTILGIPGIRDAVRATKAPVVGVSPIIQGAVVRGMADACLTAIGVATAADAVAAHYGPRSHGGVLDGWLLAEEDAALLGRVPDGIVARAVPLWMRDVALSARLAGDAVALADAEH